MTRNQDIETALRSLDAAERHVDSSTGRASAELRRILATDPPRRPFEQPRSPVSRSVVRPQSARSRTGKVVVAGGVLVTASVGIIAVPSLTGGDQAFASWTPAPRGMSGQERTDAAAGCRDAMQDGAGSGHADQLSTATPVITERRGVWTAVVLSGADGFSAMCITDSSARLFTNGVIGSVGTPTEHTTPGPRDVSATSLGVGTMDAGELSVAAGSAGDDVVGVVYPSPTYGDVAATVSQGHFALWLPGNEFEEASSDGVQVKVTFRDGSTDARRLTL